MRTKKITVLPEERIKVAVLVSGGGTNLQAIIDAQKEGQLPSVELALVVANNPEAFALQRAANAGIPTMVLTRKQCGGREAFEEALLKALETYGIEVIVLAGFMTILSEHFTSRYPRAILNVHPALIPSFCGEGFYGLKVHEAVLRSGVKVTGATVHFVNEIPDGGEIIDQKAVRVCAGDTPESLQKRVMRQAEWKLLPACLEKVCCERILEKRKEV